MKQSALAVACMVVLTDAVLHRLRGREDKSIKIQDGGNHTGGGNCDPVCQMMASRRMPICDMLDFRTRMPLCAACPECSKKPEPQPPKITYKSRQYTGSKLNVGDPEKFIMAVLGGDDSSSKYCSKNLTEASWKNTGTCPGGTKSNVGYEITVDFENKISSNWHFNFGVDFGKGGIITLDSKVMSAYAGDIWWSHNEKHANQLGFGTFLQAGHHTMTIIGAEGCCDGPSRIKFCANCEKPSDMQLLSVANLESTVDHFMEAGSFDIKPGPHFHSFSVPFDVAPVVTIQKKEGLNVWVDDVTKMGFSVTADKVDKVKFMAVRPGAHVLPDGRYIEAGRKPIMALPMTIGFEHHFGESAPLVAATVQVGSPFSPLFSPPIDLTVSSVVSATSATLSVSQEVEGDGNDKIDYIAMPAGEGEFEAKGHKMVKYKTALKFAADGASTADFGWDEDFVN